MSVLYLPIVALKHLSGPASNTFIWLYTCTSHDMHRIIYAFDKDPIRYKTLLKMVRKSGASCVVPKRQDFLTVYTVCM